MTARQMVRKLKLRLLSPPDPFLETARSRDRVQRLLAHGHRIGPVLNVGAGHRVIGPDIIGVDIFPSPAVHVIASAEALPVRSHSVGGLILQGVLEHVADLSSVVRECERVLASDGLCYCEVPFLQPYHESPRDYRRMTQFGLARLSPEMVCDETGIHMGPASTLAWFLRESIARLLSFRRVSSYRWVMTAAGWLVFPIKYLDFALEKVPGLQSVASSNYAVLRRRPVAPPE